MIFPCQHAVRRSGRAAVAVAAVSLASILSACSGEDTPRLLPACEGERCGADGNRFRGVGLGVWEYRNATNKAQVLPIALEGLHRSHVMVSLTNMSDEEVEMPVGLRGVVIDVPPMDSPGGVALPDTIPYDPNRPGRDGGPESGSNMELPNPDTALLNQVHPASLAKTLLPQQRVVLQKSDVTGVYERDLEVAAGVRVRVYVR